MGLGSGKKPIPDPGSGSRGQKGTGSRIRIRNTSILRSDQEPAGHIINWLPGFGSTIQDYASVYPDPKEIFTDTQHK